MARQARGIDERLVVTEREARSVSQETTFSHDLRDAQALCRHLWRLSQGVARRLQEAELAAGTVALKLRAVVVMIQRRLKVLLAERKIAGTPPYAQADPAQVTGLGRSTLDNLANNKTHRYDVHVLDAICTVLRNRGIADSRAG
jgi:nucleotidyltransferase/DNA polymerase involved in DNA repair